MSDLNRKILTEKHSLLRETVFHIKLTLLTTKRFVQNQISPTPKFLKSKNLTDQPVIAFSESELWNPYDNKDNWILTAGKIENIRIASKKIHGLEIKANEIFSFWKHIGNPNFEKGYVVGREIREGCIVPTIAGGLCQLSNALYDAALKANFEIVERHKHTRVIQGSLAEQDRDATVKWNYIDLRFKPNADFRIEIELTSEKLIVVFKSKQKNILQNTKVTHLDSNNLNDCYSCGNTLCFKHPNKCGKKLPISTTTYILDERWPEFDNYIFDTSKENDQFIIPLRQNFLFKTNKFSWKIKKNQKVKATTLPGIYRILKLQFAQKRKNNLFKESLKLDKAISERASRLIPVESTHVVVSQNLLPLLFESGALGGRTFDVLMTRLPMEKLHRRLEKAFEIYPHSPTLQDFRASQELINVENKALTQAQKIITPHSDIAEIFKNKVVKLNWILPQIPPGIQKSNNNKILFPASALGRKGAYEIKRLREELNLDIMILGKAIEENNFWEGKTPQLFNGDYSSIKLIIYPTYIEHQPRTILKAISMGIPVITTTACGIEQSENVTILPIGNYNMLKEEIIKKLNTSNKSFDPQMESFISK